MKITVGMGSCGIAAGANKIYSRLEKEIKDRSLNIKLAKVGCIGLCKYEPIVEVYENSNITSYVNASEDDIPLIIENHLSNNILIEKAIRAKNNNIRNDCFLKNQVRIALSHCGDINPEDINEYVELGGYQALEESIKLKPETIINEIKNSGLRGRGGAGFLTGLKWESAYKVASDIKYVCCNADEGDPGAFMDRAVLEGNPHAIIEAMAIAGYTIGASTGFIYVRSEYPLAVERLKIAIKQAKEKKYIGDNILDSNFSFNVELRLGAGAFVCGEETALIASIEGKRGEPSKKPPFPTTSGIFDKPTLINNVETLANIPQIILNGSDWFNTIGTEKSKGTKVFALGGKINTTGLIEIPIGTPLQKIIEIGGGVLNNKDFKAAQTGGPSGGCIPKELIDIPMDYENLNAIGSMMGSGGLIIMDEDTCMVDIAKFFLAFTVDESCGKCSPCRIGTTRMYEILDRITKGQGEIKDLDELENLATYIKESSLCGLGQSAPNPVLSTLRYFKDEYIEHIENKNCKSNTCNFLTTYIINDEKCIKCGLCYNNCPKNAINKVNDHYEIDQDKCIKCGLCFKNCKFKAINKL